MNIQFSDQVFTSDEQYLGSARILYHRPENEVNPQLLLYASYLEVENLKYGDNYFVPTDFITQRDAQSRLHLSATMRQVQERTWTRQPHFVAHGQAKIEKLG